MMSPKVADFYASTNVHIPTTEEDREGDQAVIRGKTPEGYPVTVTVTLTKATAHQRDAWDLTPDALLYCMEFVIDEPETLRYSGRYAQTYRVLQPFPTAAAAEATIKGLLNKPHRCI